MKMIRKEKMKWNVVVSVLITSLLLMSPNFVIYFLFCCCCRRFYSNEAQRKFKTNKHWVNDANYIFSFKLWTKFSLRNTRFRIWTIEIKSKIIRDLPIFFSIEIQQKKKNAETKHKIKPKLNVRVVQEVRFLH